MGRLSYFTIEIESQFEKSWSSNSSFIFDGKMELLILERTCNNRNFIRRNLLINIRSKNKYAIMNSLFFYAPTSPFKSILDSFTRASYFNRFIFSDLFPLPYKFQINYFIFVFSAEKSKNGIRFFLSLLILLHSWK